VGRAPEAAALVSFQSLAALFLPAEPSVRGAVVDAGQEWRLDPYEVPDADAVVWGRDALRSGRGAEGIAWMAGRERAIARLRIHPPAGLKVEGAHRLPPARLAPGFVSNRLRDLVRSGALVELWRGPRGRRAIDAAARSAGASGLFGFRPGSGGSALARFRSADGTIGVMRLGACGRPSDPAGAADALERLAPLGLHRVPRLTGRGEVVGVGWSTETLLPGRAPGALDPRLATQVASFCAALPLAEGPPRAHLAHLATLEDRFPGREAALLEARAACETGGASVPGILGHGDLWAGNLLAEHDTLTGVVDWDAWHRAAFPGTDLLHALAIDQGRGLGLGIGGVWLRRPWASDRFGRVAAPYWRALDITAGEQFLHAVGIAWWAGQVAWTVERLPHLASENGWVSDNVDAVLATLVR
jgi:hypothetical protein